MKFEDRTPIKGIFILKYDKCLPHPESKPCGYDIAILTHDGRYFEYEIVARTDSITKSFADNIQRVFSDYRFVPKTMVVLHDSIDKKEPVHLFMRILASNIGFEIRQISLNKVISRLSSLNKSYLNKADKSEPGKYRYKNRKNFSMYFIRKLWAKLIKHRKCPWITQEYDDYIQGFYCTKRRKKKLIRICAYYMSEVWRAHEADIASKIKHGKAAVSDFIRQPAKTESTVYVQNQTDTKPETGIFS